MEFSYSIPFKHYVFCCYYEIVNQDFAIEHERNFRCSDRLDRSTVYVN